MQMYVCCLSVTHEAMNCYAKCSDSLSLKHLCLQHKLHQNLHHLHYREGNNRILT